MGSTDPGQKCFRNWAARGLVTGTEPTHLTATFAEKSRSGLSKVMGENRETEQASLTRICDDPILIPHERIQTVSCMNEDIALGMPDRVLQCAGHRRDFREMPEPVRLREHLKTARRTTGFLGPFGPFAPNSFDGQFGERIRNLATERDRLWRDREIESRG